jgi:hypothetical protein
MAHKSRYGREADNVRRKTLLGARLRPHTWLPAWEWIRIHHPSLIAGRGGNQESIWEARMRRGLTALSASAVFISTVGVATAHHSFAMFDQENPIDLEGTVQEFKYTSPHTFILLVVKDKEGGNTVWNLEGGAPSNLARDGWSSKTLKPGDEIRLMVEPLRSGAPGGAWNASKIKFKSGEPIVNP